MLPMLRYELDVLDEAILLLAHLFKVTHSRLLVNEEPCLAKLREVESYPRSFKSVFYLNIAGNVSVIIDNCILSFLLMLMHRH